MLGKTAEAVDRELAPLDNLAGRQADRQIDRQTEQYYLVVLQY